MKPLFTARASRTGVPPPRGRLLHLFSLLSLLSSPLSAEPSRTELWVPTDQLDVILEKHPKAVLLSQEQYEALIRDAGKTEAVIDPAHAAPEELVIEGLKLRGKVEPGATRVRLSGELTLNVPADAWAMQKIDWPAALALSEVRSDGRVLAWIESEESMPRLNLAARGPGRCVLRFTGELPLFYRLRSGERSLDLPHIGCAGSIELELPPDAALLPGSASERVDQRITAAFDHRFVRRADSDDAQTSMPDTGLMDACRIRWIEQPSGVPESPIRFGKTGSARFEITDSALYTRLDFSAHVLRSLNGRLEAEWPVLGGPQTQISEVSGPDVLAWKQDGQTLRVTLQQASAPADVQVLLSQSIALGAAADVALPSLSVPVLLPAKVVTQEGVDLLSMQGVHETGTGDALIRLDHEAPQVKLRAAKPRLESDVDVLARIDKDSVQIERKIVLRSDRPVTEIKLTLPEGEEFIAILSKPVFEDGTTGDMPSLVSNSSTAPVPQAIHSEPLITPNTINQPILKQSGYRMTWRRVGQTIAILPAQPVSPANPLEFSVTSRLKLAKAWSGPRTPETVVLHHLEIPEAVKVAGYTALDFDDAWRVSLNSAQGLEDRDARLTPVKGRMAWFGLREHTLTFEVERAEAVFSAEVTAYALPRARTVEIEGQFALDISGAPLRSFQVQLPPDSAKLLRVTSPLIGEQQLDEKTGLWTLNLRQGSKGRQNIRFRLSLPAKWSAPAQPRSESPVRSPQSEQTPPVPQDTVPENTAPPAPTAQTITAILPRIELPQTRRFTGTWVIEANTDTQLSTQAQGMQPLDVLRAPAVVDYQPRHRITSAFTYGAAESTLTLNARRHAHSELAALVITHLQLSSVLDADGHSLHEAHLTLTHSGEQFVALQLPASAELLSTLANRQAVKPVRSTGDAIAIPLPAGSANHPETSVTVQYRLQNTPWAARGQIDLAPVTFAKNIPILTTTWHVHTPPSFGYEKVQTTLEQGTHHDLPGIVPQAIRMVTDAAGSVYDGLFEGPMSAMTERQVDFLPGGASMAAGTSVSSIAEREIGIYESKIEDFKSRLENGDKLFRSGSYVGALDAYRFALTVLPRAPNTEDWFKYGQLKYADCAVVVAKEHAKAGKYEEARVTLNKALAESPQHQSARKLLDNLDDPDRWPPANTSQHISGVEKVQKGLLLANSNVELGNYDDAISQFGDVLRTDPYNAAARRGMENAERKRLEYFSAAADQTRAKMLAQVDEKWEDKATARVTPLASNDVPRRSAGAYLTEKMDRIIFPTVQFQNATLEEAIEYLRVKSRDLDTDESDATRRSFSFILRGGAPQDGRISLDLKNVPMSEALRYITDLAQMKFKVEPYAVVISPISDHNSEMFTRAFRVSGDGFQAKNARDVLIDAGITIPDGATVAYRSATRTLVVHNTQPNLDMIEAMVAEMNGEPHPFNMRGGAMGGFAAADPFAPAQAGRLFESLDESDFAAKSGLIPLDITMPVTGRLLRFHGHQPPEPIVLRYRSWAHQIGWAALAMLVGMLFFARMAWRRPWIATLLVLVLAAWGFPLVLEGSSLAYANSATFGWLAALALRTLMRLMQAGSALSQKLEPSTTQEAAA